MDTTDPRIRFDETGKCDHCENYERNILPYWPNDDSGTRKIEPLLEQIKRDGRGRDHDCLIGVSGGLDSSYLAYVAKEKLGLRPMIFHVDAGWNSQQAVMNVERLVDGLGLDLYTEVVNWEEMQDLQLAFLKAQVPDQDVPQDLAFFSALHNFAAKNRFKYILTGGNYSTECVREPIEWGGYFATDMTYVNDVHRRYGHRPLNQFPTADILRYKLLYRIQHGVRVIKVLNNVRYIKREAEEILNSRLGWEAFQHKHHESRFTRFYEAHWMPQKFGYEKRRAHFSSLVLTKQMSRDAAIERMRRPELDDETVAHETEYLAKKLNITEDELQALFKGANRTYRDYRNKFRIITAGARILQALGLERRRFK